MIDLEKILGQAPAHIKVLIHVKPDRADRVILPESTCAYNCPRCLIEALCREVEELREERDDLRRKYDDALSQLADRMDEGAYDSEDTPPEPPWLPAPDHKPEDLADAQMVEVYDWHTQMCKRADELPWGKCGFLYRPLYSASGLPLCSAEGLYPETKYVATDKYRLVYQLMEKPALTSDGHVHTRTPQAPASEFHRKPGSWRLSLMEVMR